MELETARSLAFCVLKTLGYTQMRDLENAICEEAARLGILSSDWQRAGGLRQLGTREEAAATATSTAREVIWELLMQGILTPGWGDSNPSLPHVRLTDWGRECVDAERVVPYDRDGYLTHLRDSCPGLDDLTYDYVAEAVECFRRGCLLAAPVMLGCASEKTVLRLMQAFGNSITDPSRKASYDKKMSDPSIKRRFDHFRSQLAKVGGLPSDLKDALEIQLDGIFTLLRYARNDAGHPTGNKVPRVQVFANFQLFIPYCRRIHALITWLGGNSV